jgi:hypothetical protein
VGDEVVGDALPAGREVDGGRIHEREPCAVRRLLPTLEERGVESVPELVGGR